MIASGQATNTGDEKMRGFFVAFEGIDGCGKFTQLHKTKTWIEKSGFITTWSSEPNEISSPLGKTIKAMLRGSILKPDDPVEFQRLYVIDRAQNIFTFIMPWLAKPKSVYLIERFALSTITYGMLSGKPAQVFIDLHEEVLGPQMLWPDLTILIDISAEEAIKRISQNREQSKFFEKQEELKKVRQNYLALADFPQFKDGIAVINGERNPDKIFEDVKTVLKSRLLAHKD